MLNMTSKEEIFDKLSKKNKGRNYIFVNCGSDVLKKEILSEFPELDIENYVEERHNGRKILRWKICW